MTTDTSELTVRALRRRWKPHKERLSGGSQQQQDTAIRFHRACSWLGREKNPELTGRHGRPEPVLDSVHA